MPSVTPLLVSHASARVRPVGALWRLRGYLKPFRTQMIVMLAAALGAVAAEIAIPLLTKSVVDGAIAHHDKGLLIPLALAALGLGVTVALLNMIRRWIQSGAVADIEKSIANFAARARAGTITMEELTGGTFTITNGGVFGSLLSTPIVNAPQSAILGMHKIQDRPVVIDGQVAVRPMMYIALTYDHRIIDGREAVQFLVTVKQCLEDPARMVLGI